MLSVFEAMGGQVAVIAAKLALCGNYGALRQLWRSAPITAHSYLFYKRTLPNQVSSKSDHICQSYGHLKYSTPPGTCHVAEGATSWVRLDDL